MMHLLPSWPLPRRLGPARRPLSRLDLQGRCEDFAALLSLGEDRLAAGQLAAATSVAQIAARYAFPHHAGLFASPRLERLLQAIGRGLPTPPPYVPPAALRDRRRVLHVLTYGRPIGGDTRYVWRWIQHDQKSRHSVALTSQAGAPIPPALREAVSQSGGTLTMLRDPSPLSRARVLRQLCHQSDVVALHLFPYDIVPVIALAAETTPATVFVNHSDHTFWIGATAADIVVHLRDQDPDFLHCRRGLDPRHAALLPTPLPEAPRRRTAAEAKAALGYPPGVVLLLTIATAYKYQSHRSPSFLELVTPVIAQHPGAMLIAVGPEPSGSWKVAGQQTGNRIVALGPRSDNEVLYSAADVYLDSFPFASITSLLEAGGHGLPLLAHSPHHPQWWPLSPAAPGLDAAMIVATDLPSYHVALSRLVVDAQFRRTTGAKTEQAIAARHTATGWRLALDDVYRQLGQSPRRCSFIGRDDIFATDALDTAVAQLYAHVPSSLPASISNYVSAIPVRDRLPLLVSLWQRGFSFSLPRLVVQCMKGVWAPRGRPA